MGRNGIEMRIDIRFTQRQANKADLRKILLTEILPPVKREIATFDDHILLILDRSLDHLPYDRPEVVCQLIVIHRSKICISASDQTHLQMIDRKIRVLIFLQKFLRKDRLSGMRSTGNQNNHISTYSISPFNTFSMNSLRFFATGVI